MSLDITQSPYNCDKTGVSDSSSGLTQCVADALSQGTDVVVPGGTFKLGTPIPINGPVKMTGIGMGVGTTGAVNGYGSSFILPNATQDGFQISSVEGPVLKDFRFDSPSQKTGGTALKNIGVGGGSSGNLRLENVGFCNQYNGAELQGAFWTAVGCYFWNWKNIGLRVLNSLGTDAGDNVIRDSAFFAWGAMPTACVKYENGGAFTMSNNKLLGGWYGIWAHITNGPTGTLIIEGNSVEQQGLFGFKMSQGGTQPYGNVQIIGNEWSMVGNLNPQHSISIDQGQSGWLKNVLITENVLNLACAGQYSAISVYDGNGVDVSRNILNGNGVAGFTGISVAGGVNPANACSSRNRIMNFPSGKYGALAQGMSVDDY